MRILDHKLFKLNVTKAVLCMGVFVSLFTSGCNFLEFAVTPGAYERKIEQEYDLKAQEDKKVLIWVECSWASGSDYDVQAELSEAIQKYMLEIIKIDGENIALYQPGPEAAYFQNPEKTAKAMGIGYVLVVQVDSYEMTRLNVRDYYSGQLSTRSVLIDVELGDVVWPTNQKARSAEVFVELETRGRDLLLGRLVNGAAHCTLRYLFPCQKQQFKHPDERITIQEAAEMETF